MNPVIVHTSKPVALIGGGDVAEDVLSRVWKISDSTVAADGGARHVLQNGRTPDAVIGDLDSIDAQTRAKIPAKRIHEISEQDSTDFDKCLRNIVAPLILGVGFLGGRIDHQLAAFSVLVRRADKACLLTGEHEVVFHAPPEIALDLPVGTVVSLFPMSGLRMKSQGLEWPTDDLDFAPDGWIGTSNRVNGPVHLRADRPGMLVILPLTHLEAIASQFAEAPRWF